MGRKTASADKPLFWVQKLFEIVAEVKAELVKEYTEREKKILKRASSETLSLGRSAFVTGSDATIGEGAVFSVRRTVDEGRG